MKIRLTRHDRWAMTFLIMLAVYGGCIFTQEVFAQVPSGTQQGTDTANILIITWLAVQTGWQRIYEGFNYWFF